MILALIIINLMRAVFIRSLVVDGNFKADHLRQANRSDDVWLLNGEAFMTAQERYDLYLQEATSLSSRYHQVSVC